MNNYEHISVIIVDLAPVLKDYSNSSSAYGLYMQYPLQGIVSDILSFTDEEMDQYVANITQQIPGCNYDILLYSLLNSVLDLIFLRTRVPPVAELILLEWVDGTSAVFRVE